MFDSTSRDPSNERDRGPNLSSWAIRELNDRPDRFRDLYVKTVLELVRDGKIDAEKLTKERLAAAYGAELRETGSRVGKVLRRTRRRVVADEERTRRGFERRLADLWGPALEALNAMIIAAQEAGSEVAVTEGRMGKREHRYDPRLAAIIRLHARACLVGTEVLTLLRAGLASGAHARWRTLHEIAVICQFLRQNDDDTAERYLAHGEVMKAGNLEAYQAHAKRLGYRPYSKAVADRTRAARARLIATYGGPKIDFGAPYGWAAKALNSKNPWLDDLEAAVKLDHWRPYRNMATYPTHGGAAGITFDLGNDDPRLMPLAGASDRGLSDPGHSAAISLNFATVAVLLVRPTGDRLITASAIGMLLDDVGEAFAAADAEWKRRRRELHVRKSPGGLVD